MQWSAKTNTAGFTNVSNVKTWLPTNPNYRYLNVEVLNIVLIIFLFFFCNSIEIKLKPKYQTLEKNQMKKKNSHLDVFKKLAKIRQEPSFQTGIFKFAMINKEIFSFIRHERGYNGFLVAMNFGNHDLVVNFHYTDMLPKNAEVVFIASSSEEDNEYMENRFRPGTVISTKKVPLKSKSIIVISFE